MDATTFRIHRYAAVKKPRARNEDPNGPVVTTRAYEELGVTETEWHSLPLSDRTELLIGVRTGTY